MSKDTDFEQSRLGNLDEQSEKPKIDISELFRITPALEQAKAHKKEGALGLLGLVLLAASQLMIFSQAAQMFPQALNFAHFATVETVSSALLALLGLFLITQTLFKIARPLKARVVALRLLGLFAFVVAIIAVKSLALGHLARLLFASDPTRFELAKTGVDHASMLLGIVVVALSYSLLSALLREKKLEFKNFGKSFAALIFWVSAFYIPTYVISLVFNTHTLEAYLSISLVIAILLALIHSLFPLWFLAVGLSFHEIDESEDADEGEVDADDESEGTDTELEDVDMQKLEVAREDK